MYKLNKSTFGGRIKQMMILKGLRSKDIAKKAGISPQQLSIYASNKVKQPGMSRIVAIAEALGCSASWLAGASSDEFMFNMEDSKKDVRCGTLVSVFESMNEEGKSLLYSVALTFANSNMYRS